MGLEAHRQAHVLSLLCSAQAMGKGSEVPSSLLSFSGKHFLCGPFSSHGLSGGI